ncbi:MAG TPA: ATP-binding protein [Polyangiales bacterium]|nr:ATP-binding protein [Polyangiales bacterium]
MDDSPLDAERTRRVLSTECSVDVFHDGSAALERLASTARAPDVLVLDWVMPGVTGVDVCRFLRSAEGGYPSVGILLLTTHSDTDQIVEGLSAGANDYLAKPYEDAELLARVHSLLRARQLLERAEQAEAVSFKLLQMMPDALIAIDEARNIKFINAAASEAFAKIEGVDVGMPLSGLLPDLERRLQNQSAADTLHLPDVKIGDLLLSPTLRSIGEGQTFSTIVALRDVTESRRLDARRLDFYSMIAHDLRSPLNTLTMRTELILQGRHGVLPEALARDVHKIDDNLKSLVEMINDFLELARLDNVRYDLLSDDIDIRALIAKTMEDLAPQLDARHLRWLADSGETVWVVGDARRLRQVLTNLISNAIKFTSDRGSIATRVIATEREVEISVIDTGSGIAPQKLATLFDRYTRATDANDATPGTGLGLMIVREIVEAHGGSVGVESQLDVGSRFWFRIPRANSTP